jgi:ribosomal protein L29
MIMAKKYKIEEMDAKIQEIKKAAKEIEKLGGDIEAVKKNLVRLRASTKMLELNISDVMLVM